MENPKNAQGRKISLKELAELVGMSYEHCRKVIFEELPIASERFTLAVCRALGLNPGEMWRHQVQEKTMRRFESMISGDRDATLQLPDDNRLTKVWWAMTEDDRHVALRMMEGLAALNRKK
jgi:hypothetical protein